MLLYTLCAATNHMTYFLPCLQPSEASLSADENGAAIDKCVEQLSSRFDRQRGGFGKYGMWGCDGTLLPLMYGALYVPKVVMEP